MTANFKYESTENMDILLTLQPNKPILVSEFWPGWFDHWFEPVHNILNLEEFTEILTNIFNYKASVNFYMFHGGTNFGFMNGANHIVDYGKNHKLMFPYYAPDVTSYGKVSRLFSSTASILVVVMDRYIPILVFPPISATNVQYIIGTRMTIETRTFFPNFFTRQKTAYHIYVHVVCNLMERMTKSIF